MTLSDGKLDRDESGAPIPPRCRQKRLSVSRTRCAKRVSTRRRCPSRRLARAPSDMRRLAGPAAAVVSLEAAARKHGLHDGAGCTAAGAACARSGQSTFDALVGTATNHCERASSSMGRVASANRRRRPDERAILSILPGMTPRPTRASDVRRRSPSRRRARRSISKRGRYGE